MRSVFLLVCAAMLAWQLLLPGFIGMADNGDFPKVAGRMCLEGADHESGKFHYFEPDYIRHAEGCYNPHIPSSEIVPAWTMAKLERTFGPRRHFDIRWLGTLHALLFLGVYLLFLLIADPLPRLPRAGLSLAALWIFGDVSVVAYLNTFYGDVTAILGALAAIGAAVLLASGQRRGWRWISLFGLAALCFVTSKAQHALCAAVCAGAAAWFGGRARDRRERIAAWISAAVILGAGFYMFAATPRWYAGQSRYNLIFTKLTPLAHTPQDLADLGLTPADARFIGTHAFMRNSPTHYPPWYGAFLARTSYPKILGFYAHRPGLAFAILRSDLRDQAKTRRLFGNFPQSYGLPPDAQTRRLATWSDLRSGLFRWWPAHIAVWYAAVFIAAVRYGRGRPLLWIMAGTAGAGLIEFGSSSLADAAETARHLWMFHVLTDATLFLALVFAARLSANRISGYMFRQ